MPASLPKEGGRIAGADSYHARVSATRWLIACDDLAWADGVASALRARGATVYLLDAEGAGVQRLAMAEAEVLLLHAPASPCLRQALDGYPGLKWATPLVLRPLRLWPLQSREPQVDALAREARAAWLPDRKVCGWARGQELRLRVDYKRLGPVRLLRALAAPPGGAFQVHLSTVDAVAQVTLVDGHVVTASYQLLASSAACRDAAAALSYVLELGDAQCEVTRLSASPPQEDGGVPLQDALQDAFQRLDEQRYGELSDEPTVRVESPVRVSAGADAEAASGQLRIPSTPESSRMPLPLPPAPLPQASLEVQILPAHGTPPPRTRSLGRPLPAPPTPPPHAAPLPPGHGRNRGLARTPYPPLRLSGSRLPRRWFQVGAAAAIACGTYGALSLLGDGEQATITAERPPAAQEMQQAASAARSEPTRSEVERIVEPLAVEPPAAVAANPFDTVQQANGAAPGEAQKVPRGQRVRSRHLARDARRESQASQARGLYEQALELDPDNPRALAGLAKLHLDAGELEAARELAERAVHRRTGRYAYRMLLGRIASEQGDWAAAVVAYADALECRPKSQAAQAGLRRARARGAVR